MRNEPSEKAKKLKRSLNLLSILQVIVCLIMFFTFFKTIPWLFASPLESLDVHSEMAAKYPPPIWTKSFSVNFGAPTYYPDYHAERLGKKITFISLFVIQWLFLVVSSIYAYRARNSVS